MNAKKIFVIAVLISALVICRQSLAELLSIISDQDSVSAYLKGFGSLGLIVPAG